MSKNRLDRLNRRPNRDALPTFGVGKAPRKFWDFTPRITPGVRQVRMTAAQFRLGLIGLEPMTLRLSSACSNQLSYRPVRSDKDLLGGKGIRTPDIQLAKLALYQLSYAPGCSGNGIRAPCPT